MNRISTVALATLAIAAVFVARAAVRLAHPEFNILRFAVLGWPPYSLWVVSAAEILGAVLLLGRATFHAGVALLAVVCAAFLLTFIQQGVPEAGWGPAGMLMALVGLVWLRRSRRR